MVQVQPGQLPPGGSQPQLHQRAAPTPVRERSPCASQPVTFTEQVAANILQGHESASSPTDPFCMCVSVCVCLLLQAP